MWQRPATHAQQKHVPMSPSYDDEEDLSDLSARPAVPFTTRAYMDNDLDHLDDGAYSEEMREDLDKYGEDAPDYRNIFQVGMKSLCTSVGPLTENFSNATYIWSGRSAESNWECCLHDDALSRNVLLPLV